MLDEIPVPNTAAAQTPAVQPKVGDVEGALSALNNLAGTREVEIDLPILKTKAFIKPVNGSEELRLRTMKASGAAFIKSFNKVIFEHVRFESIKFDNFDDFESHLTPPDKSLLVFSLLDSTFSKLPEKMITCPNCGQSDTHSPNPQSLIHADTITKVWEEEKDFTEFELVSEIVPGFKVFYAMPNESERIKILETKENEDLRNNIEETGDVLSAMELFAVYVKRIEINENGKVFKLTDKIKEILVTLNKMPLELRAKLLDDLTIKKFVDFTPNFYLDITCSNLGCSKPKFKWDEVDPENDFFLKALSVYN